MRDKPHPRSSSIQSWKSMPIAASEAGPACPGGWRGHHAHGKARAEKITDDPNVPGLEKLVKLFFAPSESSRRQGFHREACRTSGLGIAGGPQSCNCPDPRLS